MLYVTVLRGLNQMKKEVESRKVSVADFEHILGQRLGGALVQREIGHSKWDEEGDDVNNHRDVADVCDPVGGVEDEGVVEFAGHRLHVLDVAAVNVVLGERLDRGLFGSDVTLRRLDETPEKAVRWGHLDCEHNLRWQVVLVGDLQRTENIL